MNFKSQKICDIVKIFHMEGDLKLVLELAYLNRINSYNYDIIHAVQKDHYPRGSALKKHGCIIFALYEVRLPDEFVENFQTKIVELISV